MGSVFWNITRIMTRYFHFDILRSPTWDDKISLLGSTLNELSFWKEYIPFLNSRRLLSIQSHYTRVCYSDASYTGCPSYVRFSQHHIPPVVECLRGSEELLLQGT